ncbi:helix-turn-helix transcriptional regulator [Lentzea sp. JNUCC 0626]|uniref:helix-turn-helix transcriptional regulator n=1 Tax=Lentzea sp. JNUCC 0626 TaxID=3367513 RepID=UPI00374921A0
MTRPIARVLSLLELLQSGGVRTVAELASRLEVDERTVRRYVGHLLDLDVPVESVRGRHGGYRLVAGYRMPPLMLSDDEALAVLVALAPVTGTASETAAAKIRRVLPARLGGRLDDLMGALAFTSPGTNAAPEAAVLLALADAVTHHRPVSIRYPSGERALHAHGLVAHAGKWYVTGVDPALGEERTFRLDRIASVRTLPGSFEPPEAFDPAERLLAGFATAPHRHEVTLRIRGSVEQIRARLPASVAVVEPGADGWPHVELRVERLDWLPGVLAALDLPFVIERPDELRDLVLGLAERLGRSAQSISP